VPRSVASVECFFQLIQVAFWQHSRDRFISSIKPKLPPFSLIYTWITPKSRHDTFSANPSKEKKSQNTTKMFLLFGLARKAANGNHDREHNERHVPVTEGGVPYSTPGYYQSYPSPQPYRSSCHQRKAERRVERQMRREERCARRMDRRGGCCGSRSQPPPPAVVVHPPQVQPQPQMYQAPMYMPMQYENRNMDAGNTRDRGPAADEPPAYEELERTQRSEKR